MNLVHDAHFWRKLAKLGATRGPEWFVAHGPAFFGMAAAALVPNARRAVIANLRRIRGPAGPVRDAMEVAQTFASYAACLTEALASGSPNARVPVADITGSEHVAVAVREKRGVVIATAHTAGWEIIGPLLRRHQGLELVMVTQPERDPDARALQDEARTRGGVRVMHLGNDPLASIALLQHLRKNGAVAVQIDRMPKGMRRRAVRLFDAPAEVPEGPLRLAQASGAPILPIFSARSGSGRYRIEVAPPIFVPRRAQGAELDTAAQSMADAMGRFLAAHPTQWFHFAE